MKIITVNVFVSIFFLALNLQAIAQSYVGNYSGELLSENNLLQIEKKDGSYLVTLTENQNSFFLLEGVLLNKELIFQLPMQDSSKIPVICNKDGDELILSFVYDGVKYQTEFSLIRSGKNGNPDLNSKNFKGDLDQRIFGVWTNLDLIDGTGKIDPKFEFKGYRTSFLSDGSVVMDPRTFQSNNMGRNIDNKDIYKYAPKSTWRTEGEIFTLSVENVDISYHYEIRNDTLILDSRKGFIYLMKKYK